jgi:hypothetical protein
LTPIAKTNYSRRLFYIGSSRLNSASAEVIIEWAGNAYGEIETPIISRNLDTSTEWSKSSATIAITKIDSIQDSGKEPREWPIVYRYEGTYDPYGNGYFEFSGRFEINAFGGLRFIPPPQGRVASGSRMGGDGSARTVRAARRRCRRGRATDS